MVWHPGQCTDREDGIHVMEKKEPAFTLSPAGFDLVPGSKIGMDHYLGPQTAAFIRDNGTHAVNGSLIAGGGFYLDQSFKQGKHGRFVCMESKHWKIL